MQNQTSKRIFRIAITTVLLLLIPLVVMQFTEEVVWDLTDFIVAGFLLFGSGLIYVLATRNTTNFKRRLAIGVATAAVLFLIWTELAVGIFGTPFAGS